MNRFPDRETVKALIITGTAAQECLVPGRTYTITGTLAEKETGKTVKDKNQNPVTASVEFTLEMPKQQKKNYKILKTEGQPVVVALSWENPLDSLESVTEELSIEDFRGTVIFDLLLCNGTGSSRCVSVYFDGENFDLQSARKIENESGKIKEITEKYLVKNRYIENGILQEEMVRIIREKYAQGRNTPHTGQ